MDLFILGIVALSALAGLRVGLVKSLGGLIGTVIAVALALLFSDDLVSVLEKEFAVRTTIAEFLIGHLPVTALSLPLPLSRVVPGDFTTPAHFLAQLSLFLGCFLVIVWAGSRLLQLVFTALDTLVSWGLLGWLNSALGLVVVVVKNLILLSILVGLVQPAIRLGAEMGFSGAVWTMNAMADSWLIPKLLLIFIMLKDMLGMGSGV